MTQTATPVELFQSKDIPKPQSFEEYEYEVAVLQNGFKILLMSSPKIDMAGCAVSVGVGSMNDPADFQGLAHFCEHMLFMGTEKYPSEDDFNEYIASGGGQTNAFTADRETVYYAKIKPDLLDGLVDRFAQFLASPMFIANAVDREVEAVNSEFEKNLQSDSRRKHDLWKSLANPRHPLAKFATGNNKTLRRQSTYGEEADPNQSLVDLRNALIDFHKDLYSANIMSAVVMGNQPLRAMRDMCFPRFASVPNKEIHLQHGAAFGQPEKPFGPEQLLKCVKIVPIREADRTVEFRFYITDQFDFWRTKPSNFLSHCLGHEGEGSLLSYLKAAGLATGLYAGLYMDDCGQSPFMVNVSATEEGITPAGVALIGEAIFASLRLIKESGCPKWALEEEQALARLRWRFRPMPGVEDILIDAGRSLLTLPPQLVFEAPHVAYECDQQAVLKLLDEFVIENACVYLSARVLEPDCKSVEQHYGTKYDQQPLSSAWVDRWKAVAKLDQKAYDKLKAKMSLRFVVPNQFIPTRFEMKAGGSKPAAFPVRLTNTDHILYHKLDTRFGLPHFVLNAKIEMPALRPTMEEYEAYLRGKNIGSTISKASCFKEANWLARNAAVAAFARCIMESLTEETYDATLAGVSFMLASTVESYARGSGGLELGGEGFDDKGGEVIRTLLDHLASLDVSDLNVRVGLEAMRRRLSNRLKSMSPYLYVLIKSYEVVVPSLCSEEELLEQLDCLTDTQLRKLTAPCGKKIDPEMTRGAMIEGLVVGNVTEEEARTKYFSPELWQSFVPTEIDYSMGHHRLAPGHLDLREAREVVRGMQKDSPYMTVRSDMSPADVATDKRPLCFTLRGKTSNASDANCGVALFLQGPNGSAEWTAFSNVLQNWIYTKFFDELRTKEALGYAVMTTAREHCTALNRVLLVQSAKDSNFVVERVINFMQKYFFDGSEDMTVVKPKLTDAEFDSNRQATIAALAELPKELKTIAQRYTAEIFTRRYSFDRRQQQVAFLKSLSFDKFKEMFAEFASRPWLLLALDPKPVEYDWAVGTMSKVNFVDLKNARGLQAELFLNQHDKIHDVMQCLPA